MKSMNYRKTSNISRTLVGSKLTQMLGYIFILDLTPGYNGLGIDNCKTRRESFRLCDLGRLILDILR